MLKPVLTVLLLAALAGCGAAPTMTAASRAAGAAAAMATTSTMVVASASEKDGTSPNPGHLLPETEDFKIEGTGPDGRFSLALHAVNPGGELFVPKVGTVMLNGKAVGGADVRALGEKLRKAKTKKADAVVVSRAASILMLGS